jgi:hypothetical protein
MRQLFCVITLCLGAVPAAAEDSSAPALSAIQIAVHLSTGLKQHAAPTLGAAPVTLEWAMQAAGVAYTASWFSSVPGYAAMIIDDQPATTNGKFGSPFWWACVNGYSSAAGLQTFIKGGDQIDWLWVTEGNKCPKDTPH